MACTEQRREQIAALAAGRSDAAAAANLLEHVAACRDCSQELDLVADLVAAQPQASAVVRGPWGGIVALAALLLAALWLWQPWSGGSRYGDLAQIAPIQAPSATLRGPEEERRGEDYARALEAYRAGEFATAAELLAGVGGRLAEDALVHLYLGIARLQVGEPAAAVPPLEIAAAQGTGLVRERGLWYLAGAWLLQEQADAARAVLAELRAEDGDYAANAEALLEALRQR